MKVQIGSTMKEAADMAVAAAKNSLRRVTSLAI